MDNLFRKRNPDADEPKEEKEQEKAQTPVAEKLAADQSDVAKEVKDKKAEAVKSGRKLFGKQGKFPVQSLWPGTLVVNNAPSGTRYVWDKTGAIVQVLEEDLETLRAKNRRMRECCGGGETERVYFEFLG